MKSPKILTYLLTISLVFTFVLIPAYAAYGDYSVVFNETAIDATTRWGAPSNKSGLYINSKWAEVRSVGTSPHVGMDIPISNVDVLAVMTGTLTKVSDDSTYNTHSLESSSKSGLYCHYEHMSQVTAATGVRLNQGAVIGKPGNKGSESTGIHLHFGAYTSSTMSSRKAYRNETLYRDSSYFLGGRGCDVFSQVGWQGNRIGQITACFSGINNDNTELPKEMRVYWRVAGTSNKTWKDGGEMTYAGNYTYTYDFSNVVASGTSIEWTVRITRDIPKTKNVIFAPAKYYNPDKNPNSSSDTKYAFFTNTVRY